MADMFPADWYTVNRVLLAADPDGQEKEPTDADYAAVDAWVVKDFGPAVLAAYRRQGRAPGDC